MRNDWAMSSTEPSERKSTMLNPYEADRSPLEGSQLAQVKVDL